MPKLEMAFFSNNRIAKYKPETRNPKPETRNPKPKTQNHTLNPKPYPEP